MTQVTLGASNDQGTGPENYEKYFVPAIGRPLADDLLTAATLRPGEQVLDVACGTGVVTRLAARQVGRAGSVAGLDVNPGMLSVARAVTPSDMAVDWYETSAEAMPLADGAFDVVLCQMGMQFVADKLQALKEIRRVLKPGGRVVLNLPGPTPQFFCRLCRRACAAHRSQVRGLRQCRVLAARPRAAPRPHDRHRFSRPRRHKGAQDPSSAGAGRLTLAVGPQHAACRPGREGRRGAARGARCRSRQTLAAIRSQRRNDSRGWRDDSPWPIAGSPATAQTTLLGRRA